MALTDADGDESGRDWLSIVTCDSTDGDIFLEMRRLIIYFEFEQKNVCRF